MRFTSSLQKSLVNLHAWLFLKHLMRTYPVDPQGLRRLQQKKLRRLLVKAYENHDFYRQRMIKAGLDPYRNSDLTELRKLPPLTREEYRTFTNSLLKKNPDKYRNWYFDQTSGSTGTPLKIVRSWPERAYMLAKWLRAVYMNGYRCTDQTFRIMAPHRITEKKDTLLQYLGLFRFSQISYYASGKEMVEAYQGIQPDFFYANRCQMEDFACYIRDFGIEIKRPKIYSVGAEVISRNSRELFNSVLGKDNFFENYGCEEMGNLAFQLKGVDGLNFCHDTNILELVSPDGSISDEGGEALITDLDLHEFPMIRYRLGDTIETFKDNSGIQGIRSIRGRTEDRLLWKDGSQTSNVYFYEILGRFGEDISRFSIVQESWETIRILVVPSPEINTEISRENLRKSIIADLRAEISPDVELKIDFVSNIPPKKNGKMGIITSNIDKEDWLRRKEQMNRQMVISKVEQGE